MTEEPPAPLYTATVRRRRRQQPAEAIRTPDQVYRIVRPLVSDASREHFFAVYLSTRHAVLRVELVALGSLNASIVHPREVFKPAIEISAASLVVCHNHPSGDPSPSEDDIEMTHRLCRGGEILGIELLDHVIIANGNFLSFREQGILS
jgi:DNA repair protein RadC